MTKNDWAFINGKFINLTLVTDFDVVEPYPSESGYYNVIAGFVSGISFWEKEEKTLDKTIILARVLEVNHGHQIILDILSGRFPVDAMKRIPDPILQKEEESSDTEKDKNDEIPF